MAREATKQDEFLEAAFDLGHWFEKHWKLVLRWGAVALAVAVIVAAVLGWRNHRAAQATESIQAGAGAFDRAAAAQYADFDALADALMHFEEAEEKAGGADPGPLATYYRGVTLFRLAAGKRRSKRWSPSPPRSTAISRSIGPAELCWQVCRRKPATPNARSRCSNRPAPRVRVIRSTWR